MLYIVSTPIGNLKDISLRALDVLREVNLIAAEDTRHTRILLKHYAITTPVTSYFEHNKIQKAAYLLRILKEGKKVALVTDAGTPGISDPGYHLICLVKDHNIPLMVIPGPTALIAALSLSGLPAHAFIFGGFLPSKKVVRQKVLVSFKKETRTVIFYESPHRIISTLKDIEKVLGDPFVVCVREITKKFEEVQHNKASALAQSFEKKKPRGEFVILFNLEKKVQQQQKARLENDFQEAFSSS